MTATDTVRRLYDAFASGDGEALGYLLGEPRFLGCLGHGVRLLSC